MESSDQINPLKQNIEKQVKGIIIIIIMKIDDIYIKYIQNGIGRRKSEIIRNGWRKIKMSFQMWGLLI